LFAKLGNERVAATSSAQVPLETAMSDGVRGRADVGVLATRNARGDVAVLLWNYHDDDVPGPDAAVHVDIRGLKWMPGATARLWRIDGVNANSYAAWRAMGAPIAPNAAQYRELEEASLLREVSVPVTGRRREAGLDLVIPRQGVALLVLDR
jgi:xylan 1,4-beta-xylosidase